MFGSLEVTFNSSNLEMKIVNVMMVRSEKWEENVQLIFFRSSFWFLRRVFYNEII